MPDVKQTINYEVMFHDGSKQTVEAYDYTRDDETDHSVRFEDTNGDIILEVNSVLVKWVKKID